MHGGIFVHLAFSSMNTLNDPPPAILAQALEDNVELIDMGEAVSENRVARLARLAGIQAQIGYKKKPGVYGGKPSVVVDNTLLGPAFQRPDSLPRAVSNCDAPQAALPR